MSKLATGSERPPRICARASRGFEAIPFEWRDPELWPTVDVSELTPDAQARFERLSRAIRHYMVTGGKLTAALTEARCSKAVFYEQLARCVKPVDGLGTIVGWEGLLWNKRFKVYARVNEGDGHAGRFSKWLRDNLAWEKRLIALIKKGGGGKTNASQAPNVRSVASQLIAEIKASCPESQYPRTTKSCGRRSIERYITRYISMNLSTTEVWFGKGVAVRQHLGSGHFNFPLAAAPFDVVGCDAHVVDAIGIVIIDGPAGLQRVPVERMKLVPVICLYSRCVSGYDICIQPEISAANIEAAYLMGTYKWTPLKLSIGGVSYDHGAGFPVGVIDGLDEVQPAAIHLDNAGQHFGKGVQQRIRRSVGCLVRWGGVGHWWRNAVVERFFQTLTHYGFKRLPSSTGSGPHDPLRPENPVAMAAGKGIEWHELIQLLDVLIANYNCKPSRALGGRSPLDVIRGALEARRGAWVPRMRPPYGANSPRPGIEIVGKRINGYVDTRVAPYVELDGTRYSSPELSMRYDWIGRKVCLHVPEDMRTVEAFLQTGERIGVLRCLDRSWGLTAHSRQHRRLINRLIKDGELYVADGGDPVAAYLDFLTTKAYGLAPKSPTLKVSRSASDAAELQRSTDVVPSQPKVPEQAANAPRFERHHLPVGVRLPTRWK